MTIPCIAECRVGNTMLSREESWQYQIQCCSFSKLQGVWKYGDTLSWVFDVISSQLKIKLRRETRIKNIKTMLIKIRYPNTILRHDVFISMWPYTHLWLWSKNDDDDPNTIIVIITRVGTGPGKPGKSWNFILAFSRTGKSWKKATCPGKFWKSG